MGRHGEDRFGCDPWTAWLWKSSSTKRKENGGIRVGNGFTVAAGPLIPWKFICRLPASPVAATSSSPTLMANSEYEESWSDPEIEVYSGTGLQLAGPSEVSVDTLARFSGRLSEEIASGVANQEIQIAVDGQPASFARLH